jgi:hypothetical protein
VRLEDRGGSTTAANLLFELEANIKINYMEYKYLIITQYV